CVFFFSSRRRHTRSYGDWSSDVCSSDLGSGYRDVPDLLPRHRRAEAPGGGSRGAGRVNSSQTSQSTDSLLLEYPGETDLVTWNRSEERRVGKEGRSRGSRAQ